MRKGVKVDLNKHKDLVEAVLYSVLYGDELGNITKRDAYYTEFRDTNGVYRSWKQNFDGGHAYRNDAQKMRMA